ncbi:fumarylacetoacetate hydrolase family protein [Sulfitobacter sp. TSTF-M16]|uniref:Fumarylacetoacetate hydrolase family protein n=1 Tax=Sulfitobacter aestuariivivens TaxID=2766981 RepID=A0A927HDZ3_9RHOB|nr:fumarylacetoacetate hydrolase family protein [Sulfitobacter aestuariivivens]MBD3662843.1 fumarylacetoacetate hydrolase family protein [Sulfitobacter aestuariivivens]
MKFATVSIEGRTAWGHITDEGFHDLGAMHPQWPTLRDVIAAGALSHIPDTDEIPTLYRRGFSYEIPVPNPEKIICVGVNFPDRNAEYKDGQDAPPNMSLFPRFPRSFVGHGHPLTRPPESEKLDYEGEIAIVVGTGGRRIPQDSALSHIAGLTLCNEGTIRDWVRHAKFNVTQGKNWDGSGAMGPWLIPFKSDTQLTDIELTTEVNGELRQQDRTSRMLFPIARQIAYISTFTTLVPGDIIVTGTPTGAGARFDPPRFLKPGDEIKVIAQGIGTLINGVRDE